MTMEPVVVADKLTRKYRRVTALDTLSLSVPQGQVLGLVGENGAGKSTLIKHILGMLRAQSGTMRVFGLDPVKEPVKVLSRIGYLSENRDLPGWMRVRELMRYCHSLYPGWDPKYAEELRKLFELDPTAKLRTLSLGQTAKTGLLAALAHKPDLLVLDEPSSGLDPVVRRDILGAIFRSVAHEGRTVLFSSHLLEEVELVADRIAMVHAGKLMVHDSLEQIKLKHHRVLLRSPNGQAAAPQLPGALSVDQGKEGWKVVCYAPQDQVKAAAQSSGYEVVDISPASLDDIFVARAGTPITEGSE
jgi:ABC-2 type transport system ATP-binding protein